MKRLATIFKALLATIGVFGVAFLLTCVPVLWTWGWAVTLGVVFIVCFVGTYIILNE